MNSGALASLTGPAAPLSKFAGRGLSLELKFESEARLADSVTSRVSSLASFSESLFKCLRAESLEPAGAGGPIMITARSCPRPGCHGNLTGPGGKFKPQLRPGCRGGPAAARGDRRGGRRLHCRVAGAVAGAAGLALSLTEPQCGAVTNSRSPPGRPRPAKFEPRHRNDSEASAGFKFGPGPAAAAAAPRRAGGPGPGSATVTGRPRLRVTTVRRCRHDHGQVPALPVLRFR